MYKSIFIGEPNYAAIAGGIVGISIVICIIVGVFLLRYASLRSVVNILTNTQNSLIHTEYMYYVDE